MMNIFWRERNGFPRCDSHQWMCGKMTTRKFGHRYYARSTNDKHNVRIASKWSDRHLRQLSSSLLSNSDESCKTKSINSAYNLVGSVSSCLQCRLEPQPNVRSEWTSKPKAEKGSQCDKQMMSVTCESHNMIMRIFAACVFVPVCVCVCVYETIVMTWMDGKSSSSSVFRRSISLFLFLIFRVCEHTRNPETLSLESAHTSTVDDSTRPFTIHKMLPNMYRRGKEMSKCIKHRMCSRMRTRKIARHTKDDAKTRQPTKSKLSWLCFKRNCIEKRFASQLPK